MEPPGLARARFPLDGVGGRIGELLFTPRVGALHGYSLLWAMLLALALKWFINREVGRFAVCTGQTLLQGFNALPGPRMGRLADPRPPVLRRRHRDSGPGGRRGSRTDPRAAGIAGRLDDCVGARFMIAGVFVGFWDTVHSDQEGHGRMFADGSRLVVPAVRKFDDEVLRRLFVAVPVPPFVLRESTHRSGVGFLFVGSEFLVSGPKRGK